MTSGKPKSSGCQSKTFPGALRAYLAQTSSIDKKSETVEHEQPSKKIRNARAGLVCPSAQK